MSKILTKFLRSLIVCAICAVFCAFGVVGTAHAESECLGATFFDQALNSCTPCPAYYDADRTDGKDNVSQCKTQCAPGKYVERPGVYGYTQLEYLESLGGQYIKTDEAHKSTYIRGEIRIGASKNITTNVNIIGNQVSGTGGYALGYNGNFKIWSEADKNRLDGPITPLNNGDIYDIEYEITNTHRYLKHTGMQQPVSKTHKNKMVTSNKIHLFDNGAHQMNQNFAGRIYYIRLYEKPVNEQGNLISPDAEYVLVHNYIPVKRNHDDAIGIYDTVDGKFYMNAGNGEFISGDERADPCVDAGQGYYASPTPVNFGSTNSRSACPAGTYSDIENASSINECQACPSNTYNGGTAASRCSPCPSGYNYNPSTGNTNVNQCQIECSAGTYLPTTISSGYTELKSIELTGSQYINTGVNIKDLVNPIMMITMQYTSLDTGKQSGAVNSATNTTFKVGISNGGYFLCQAAGADSEVLFGAADMNKHTFTLNAQNRTCTMDDQSKNLTVADFSNENAVISIGTLGTDTSNRISKAIIYKFELISNNEVIRNMVPARNNTTGAIGMLDTINNQFYPNSGTGTIIAGDDVEVQLCTDVGFGYYSPGGVVNYGTNLGREPCPDGKTTMVTNASSSSQCVDEIHEYSVTYSCGDGTGTPPATALAKEVSLFTPAANSCTRANYIFTGWAVSGTNDVLSAQTAFIYEYPEDKTLTAQWSQCAACDATNATCEYNGVVNNVCTYTTTCNTGYEKIQNNGQYNPICTPITCENATYLNNNECVPCPPGYNADVETGKTSISECKIHCDGGSYIANANDATCTNAGVGYWISENTVNYGYTNSPSQCPNGLTTIGYGAGADEANDCGHVLRIGNNVIYLRKNKKTPHTLNLRINDEIFYANMSLQTMNMHDNNPLHLKTKIDGSIYYIYDDSGEAYTHNIQN